MTSTPTCGNWVTRLKKPSLDTRSATSGVVASTVAVRGTSHRIAISPTMSLRPTVATVVGPLIGLHDHVGGALQHDVGGVARLALPADRLARPELDMLAGEGEQLEPRRLDLREQRDLAQDLDVLLEGHGRHPSLLGGHQLGCGGVRPRRLRAAVPVGRAGLRRSSSTWSNRLDPVVVLQRPDHRPVAADAQEPSRSSICSLQIERAQRRRTGPGCRGA